ncbi:DUF2911 domain-containing protein [Maribacter sp. TH_r10]|uniref:DUF2911 domain-containing protein n=1 Tax=Maribacter sp. TH_r10 TaxID=3082086 RepID=UPI002952BC6B|nr:DUF2911 domain-containing protein [Maribacter sp. TH_r10]MDV7139403.1 DUF2911 domain-containing protein [Maribacter sp. TH_r10]
MARGLLLIFAILIFGELSAQINHPKASPYASISQDVGLTNIHVEYSRPAVRGRKIFGELVPYGRIWRVGANESTKITFSSNVMVNDSVLEKGTYALYAFPEANNWEVVFHKNITHWGDGRDNYNPAEDALRVQVKPNSSKEFQENFLISFDSIDHNSLQMTWHWAYTQIRIPIHVDTHSFMQGQIESELKANPSAQTYYEAARYYQEQGIRYKEALEYLDKAIEIGGDTYYFNRVKSLVEAAMEDYSSAISSAQKSLELANLQGKDEFVRMNEENIAKWKARLIKNQPNSKNR